MVMKPQKENESDSGDEEVCAGRPYTSIDEFIRFTELLASGLETESFMTEEAVIWLYQMKDILIQARPMHMHQATLNEIFTRTASHPIRKDNASSHLMRKYQQSSHEKMPAVILRDNASEVISRDNTRSYSTLIYKPAVYLLASCSPWELVKQRRIWCIFVGWLMMGVTCLALSLLSMILHLSAATRISYTFIHPESHIDEILLCGGAVGSLWLEDIVVVMGVLLYCTQCHLLSRLLEIIRMTLYQGATSLMGIKKQIDETSRFLRHLNQELGSSVGLYLCLVAFRAITAASSICSTIKHYEVSAVSAVLTDVSMHKNPESSYDSDEGLHASEHTTVEHARLWLHISALITNLIPWLTLTIMPLCMAARVSSNYRALSKAGSQLHGRPFGYQSTPQPDIDSFLLYVSSLHLQAKILWIPVRTYFLVSILVLSIMSLVVLSYLYL